MLNLRMWNCWKFCQNWPRFGKRRKLDGCIGSTEETPKEEEPMSMRLETGTVT